MLPESKPQVLKELERAGEASTFQNKTQTFS